MNLARPRAFAATHGSSNPSIVGTEAWASRLAKEYGEVLGREFVRRKLTLYQASVEASKRSQSANAAATKQTAEVEAHRAEVAKLEAERESLKRTAVLTEESNRLKAENAALRKQLRRREGFIGTILRGFKRSGSDKQPIASVPAERPKRTSEGLASKIKVPSAEVASDTPGDDAEKPKGFAGKIRFK